MKKVAIILAIFLVGTSIVPFASLAAESNPNQENYNELGIKKGTEVYGEDISELTEEELQYVPKAWRDGEVESEHRGETDTATLQGRSYPDVNNYILSNNLSTAYIEYDYKDVFPKFGYRNGYNKVEGIVAHETANNYSTITGEISYMTRNYNRAFVHAFVDDSRVIEIHPTKYAAWGAGRFANERFIHIELVRTHSFEAFAKSIDNYSEYTATLMHKHGLALDDAERDGKGTLWSHRAVSEYLGGTTHVDPHGFFARWGYKWDDFVRLVKIKYDRMVPKVEKVDNKLGRINTTKARYHGTVSDLTNPKMIKSSQIDKTYYLPKKVKRNGVTYYLLQTASKRPIGWMQEKYIDRKTFKSINLKDTTGLVKGTGNAYSLPWATPKNAVFETLTDQKGAAFDMEENVKIGEESWYAGTLKGKRVWVKGKDINYFADVKNTSSHYDSIYTLAEQGTIQGYPMDDGTRVFRQWEPISRAHAAALFTNSLDLPVPKDINSVLKKYSDINSSHPQAKAIAAATKAGLFRGSNGKFMDQPMNRQQMATVIALAFELKDNGQNVPINVSNVLPSHKKGVKLLAQYKITNQLDDFHPSTAVKRGQFSTFLYNAMKATNK